MYVEGSILTTIMYSIPYHYDNVPLRNKMPINTVHVLRAKILHHNLGRYKIEDSSRKNPQAYVGQRILIGLPP